MITNKKLFIAGITSAEYANIIEMIEPVKEVIDGLCFVVDSKGVNDGTWEYLNENKKAGKIISHPWPSDFSVQFNEMLVQGNMEHNKHWYIQLDSRERVNKDFIIKCKESFLDELDKQNIVACYQRSKPCLIKFNKFLRYFGNPHCGISPFLGNAIDLAKMPEFQDDKTYIWSERVGDESWVKNGLKYMLMPYSNHTVLVWGEIQRFTNLTKEQVELQYKQHENARNWFLHYWSQLFDKWPTIEDITEYMKTPDKWDIKLKEYFSFEMVFTNHYRWQILGEKIQDIMSNQWNWNLKETLEKKIILP